jgi:hypothetical protein
VSSGHAVNADPKSGLVIDNALVSLVLDGELLPKARDTLRSLCRIRRDIVERNKPAGSYKWRVHVKVLPYPVARMVAVNEEKVD